MGAALKKAMDEVKIDSYEDCVWYLPDVDRCKLPSIDSPISECTCKNELDDFCISITKFMKSTLPCQDEDDFKFFNPFVDQDVCEKCEGFCDDIDLPITEGEIETVEEKKVLDMLAKYLSKIFKSR